MTWIYAEWLPVLYAEFQRPIQVCAKGIWSNGAIAWLKYLGHHENGSYDWILEETNNENAADVVFETEQNLSGWDFQSNDELPETPSDVALYVRLEETRLSDEAISILIISYKAELEARLENLKGIAEPTDSQTTSLKFTQKYLDDLRPDSFGGDDLGVINVYPNNSDGLMLLYKDMFTDYLRENGIMKATKDLLEFERAKLYNYSKVENYKDGLTKKQWNAIFAAVLDEMKK